MAEQVMDVDSEDPDPDLIRSDDWGFITDSGQWAVFRVSEERALEAQDNHQYGTLVKNIRSNDKYEVVSQKEDAHTISPSGVSEEEQTQIASMESKPNGWGSMWYRTGDYLTSITNIFGGSDEALETKTETKDEDRVSPEISEEEVSHLRDDVASLHSLVADLQDDLNQLQEDVNTGSGVVELLEEHTGEELSPDEVAEQLLSGSVESSEATDSESSETEETGSETEETEKSEEDDFTLDKPPMDDYDYDVDEDNLPELSELEKVILTEEEQERYRQLQAALGPLPNIGWANPFVTRDDLSSDDLAWYEDIKQEIESARLKGIDASDDQPLQGVTVEESAEAETPDEPSGGATDSEPEAESDESDEPEDAEETETEPDETAESDEDEEEPAEDTGGGEAEAHGNGMAIHTGPAPSELNSFDVDEDLEDKLSVDVLTLSESERNKVQLYRARKMKAARDQGLL